MPFNVKRFTDSLEAHIGGDFSAELKRRCQEFGTLKSPTRKARWIKSLMDTLDSEVDESVRKGVMEDCGRMCISRNTLKIAKRHKQKAKDIDDFLDRLNQDGIGGGELKRDGNIIHASYKRCYCGSVSKTKEPISSTYCNCSCGWYKELFETALERSVEVELVDSIIQGGQMCKFIIHI